MQELILLAMLYLVQELESQLSWQDFCLAAQDVQFGTWALSLSVIDTCCHNLLYSPQFHECEVNLEFAVDLA